MGFDNTAKVSFDHIYGQPDPREFYRALSGVDYCIPELAKPYFLKVVQEYREVEHTPVPTILDVGCSYGVNSAMLRCDATMDELAEHYRAAESLDHDALVAHDREFVRTRNRLDDVRFVGFDASEPALAYAHAAGYLDSTVHADLEADDPTPEQREQLAGVDLVISTGCIGYVSEKTITRVALAQGEHRPWMAHFVLRMFSYDPIANSLAQLGYETEQVDGVFKQRRFASQQEQTQVLDALAEAGVDSTGLEADGWYYARLFISRPIETIMDK